MNPHIFVVNTKTDCMHTCYQLNTYRKTEQQGSKRIVQPKDHRRNHSRFILTMSWSFSALCMTDLMHCSC